MAPVNWPVLSLQGAFVTVSPAQPAGTFILNDATNGKLGTGKLGAANTYSDLSSYVRSGSIARASTREAGPVWHYSPGTASIKLNNEDGRFDPDNLGGPYVAAGASELVPMVPIRVKATWRNNTYGLFDGFADSWEPEDGSNYAGRYAEATLGATDAQKVLAGLTLATISAAGAGETTGSRINRILGAVGWYTGSGKAQIATGNSTVQATTYGDTAWNLLLLTSDSEIGQLYINGSGAIVFRNRQALLSETRSNTPQAVFGDSIGTVESAGTEQAYRTVTRARDDTTLANDIQATRAGGTMQEAFDSTSITTYLFARTYVRSDLILQDDTTTLNWAQWVLYIGKNDENRFDQIVLFPLRDPENLWPQALGREIGDRIQIWRRAPGVASATVKDCFIQGITHDWDVSANNWTTTWTLQDASKYGSFLVLNNATLGRLNHNALAF